MKKRSISIVLNILIIIFEIIGIIYNIKYNHRLAIEFYTEDSNLLLLISSLLFIIYNLLKEKIPKWLSTFKYLSTIGVTLTLLVVLLILVPMGNFDFKAFMFTGTLLFHHTICPILGITTFLLFDDLGELSKKDSVIGLSFTFIYSIIMIILNLMDKMKGPYYFLMVKDHNILESIMWLILIYGMAYYISYTLRYIYTRVRRS